MIAPPDGWDVLTRAMWTIAAWVIGVVIVLAVLGGGR
jgi:hypothetical protein